MIKLSVTSRAFVARRTPETRRDGKPLSERFSSISLPSPFRQVTPHTNFPLEDSHPTNADICIWKVLTIDFRWLVAEVLDCLIQRPDAALHAD